MNVTQQKEEQWQHNKGKVCKCCSVMAAVTWSEGAVEWFIKYVCDSTVIFCVCPQAICG